MIRSTVQEQAEVGQKHRQLFFHQRSRLMCVLTRSTKSNLSVNLLDHFQVVGVSDVSRRDQTGSSGRIRVLWRIISHASEAERILQESQPTHWNANAWHSDGEDEPWRARVQPTIKTYMPFKEQIRTQVSLQITHRAVTGFLSLHIDGALIGSL